MDGADLTPRCRSALIRRRWFCAFEAAGKSKLAVAVWLLGLTSVAAAFASFPACAQSVAQALQEITDTADRLCGNVATSGQTNAASGAAEVKAELNGLAKRLADLGVSASGSTSSSTYEGVIQQELPTALRDVRECKLKVFQTLQEKLLPDAQSTPGPHSEQAPQKLDCGGNSDNLVATPILNVFSALRAKDIALYSNQWSDDAIYKNAKSGAVWDKTQIVARKHDAFAKWGQVRATVYGLAVLSKNDDHATLEDSYHLDIEIGGRIISDSGRERYIGRCGPTGRWQIVQNVDYM
jgi:hypothetical protein